MMNAKSMAILDGRDDLKEDGLDEVVFTEVKLLLGDGREEVAVGAEIHDDKDPLGFFKDTVQSDDAWVSRSELVQGNFTTLEFALAGVQAGFREALDGIPGGLLWGRIGVDCKVNDAVCTGTEDRNELNATAVDALAGEVVSGGVDLGHFGG